VITQNLFHFHHQDRSKVDNQSRGCDCCCCFSIPVIVTDTNTSTVGSSACYTTVFRAGTIHGWCLSLLLQLLIYVLLVMIVIPCCYLASRLLTKNNSCLIKGWMIHHTALRFSTKLEEKSSYLFTLTERYSE
jgi:hypothetical protein